MNPQLDLSEMVTNDRRNYTKTGTSAFNLGVAPNGRRFQRFSVRHPGGWFRAPPISFTPRPKKMPRRDDSRRDGPEAVETIIFSKSWNGRPVETLRIRPPVAQKT